MELNETLKLLRHAKGLTQKEVAKTLGIKQYNLSDYEIGRAVPSIDILKKLADLYEVTLDDLCGNTSSYTKPTSTSIDTINEYVKDLHTLKIIRRIQPLTDQEKEQLYTTIDSMIKAMFRK